MVSDRKKVAILCGGATYEHEVSIITGIQVYENIDESKYQPFLVYADIHNQFWLLKDFASRKDFKHAKRVLVFLKKTDQGASLVSNGILAKEIPIDICYMAAHGGPGESGQVQGLLELLGVPFTSASQEGSVIAMNKALSKEVLNQAGVPVLPWVNVFSSEYKKDQQKIIRSILKKLSLPLIIKPVHLGSSIGIKIVETEVQLEKELNVAIRLDTEVLIEPALREFTEYNVSVRTNQGAVELSPIEEPKREGDMLSFDDKYANGSKKTGGNKTGGGMELLDRTFPAKISAELENEIDTLAKSVYRAARLAGLLRIDFMYSEGKLYCTEINPIPGSMSFFLWEPRGEQFQDQVTSLLEDALARAKDRVAIQPYETDIVDAFIGH